MTQKAEHTLTFLNSELDSNNSNVYCTSSFQTQSVPLLYLISNYFHFIKIIFIDTGYLFPETYAFKNELESKFNLDIIILRSNLDYNQQLSKPEGLPLYCSDINRCCYINKVEPIKDYFKAGDVWISGVRRDQTANRAAMKERETDINGVIRLHPMLEWTSKDIYMYLKEYNLPKHPLENSGYLSIGCVPCTQKWDGYDLRDSRWTGSKKTECGLHTENRKA